MKRAGRAAVISRGRSGDARRGRTASRAAPAGGTRCGRCGCGSPSPRGRRRGDESGGARLRAAVADSRRRGFHLDALARGRERSASPPRQAAGAPVAQSTGRRTVALCGTPRARRRRIVVARSTPRRTAARRSAGSLTGSLTTGSAAWAAATRSLRSREEAARPPAARPLGEAEAVPTDAQVAGRVGRGIRFRRRRRERPGGRAAAE